MAKELILRLLCRKTVLIERAVGLKIETFALLLTGKEAVNRFFVCGHLFNRTGSARRFTNAQDFFKSIEIWLYDKARLILEKNSLDSKRADVQP